MKMLYTLLMIGWLPLCAPAQDALFERAQAAYDDGRYAEAAHLYEQMISNGVANAEVHYNFANACFKNSELPNAVQYYRLAAYELPRDPDIAANLYFALNAAGAVEPAPSFVERFLSTLSKSEWILAGTGGYLLLAVLLILLLFMKNQRRPLARLLALPILMLALAGLGWRYWRGFETHPEWVVIRTEATALFGPVEGSTAHFKLPPGALVRQRGSDSKGWIEVEYDGKRGWLKQDYIRPVSP
ncbi:tetratricopeptide repeat protein [Pontiella sp.]|uniref:tetratricopeptide repeat protein n=1 Tax=Pontiella sp. TaxID=2837462 RepID=UPI0035638A87